MDAYKETLFLERRQAASKDIPIIFTDPLGGFITLKKHIKDGIIKLSNIKYFGKITKKQDGDSCTCQSFYHGNTYIWTDTHGFSFQCKHIIRAREERGW